MLPTPSSGSNPSPTPRFAPGLIGQAFEYTTTTNGDIEYATFGYPADLQFDSTNDFSVSLWVNYTNQSDDLPFIGNKDWGSSGNEGWVITTQSGGNCRVNVTGAASSDKYSQTDFPSVLKDGKWHNLVVSIQHAPAGQRAYVYGYVDGLLRSKHPMTAVGSVDTLGLPFSYAGDNQTNWAVNVGQDGTGTYTDGGSAYDINAMMDDLGVWRRALTANEAVAIYEAGLKGEDLTQAASAGLFATVSGGNLMLTWQGGSNVELETTPSLSPAQWTVVSGTLGASSASIPLQRRHERLLQAGEDSMTDPSTQAPVRGDAGQAPVAEAWPLPPRRSCGLLGWVVLSYMGVYLCRKNFSVAVPMIQKAFAVNKAQTGDIISYSAAAYAVGKVIFGPVVDRFGGRICLLLVMAGVALFGGLGAFAGSVPMLALCYSANRFCGSAGWGAIVKQTPRWFPPRHWALAMAFLSLSFVFGGVVALVLAGKIAAWRGNNWRMVMGLPSLVLLALLVIIWRVLPSDRSAVTAGRNTAWNQWI